MLGRKWLIPHLMLLSSLLGCEDKVDDALESVFGPSNLASITFSHTNFDFQSVIVGDSVSQMIQVTNKGISPAERMNFQLPTSEFSFTGGAFPGRAGTCAQTLAANRSCFIQISYSPTDKVKDGIRLSLAYFNGLNDVESSLGFFGTGHDPPPLEVTEIIDDPVPTKIKIWNWSCTRICQYRYVITASPTHTFTNESWSGTRSLIHNATQGLTYLHIEPRDADTHIPGTVKTVSAIIDNVAPIVPSNLLLGSDSTLTVSDTISFSAATDDIALSHYLLGIGTTAGGTEVMSFENIGNVTTYQMTSLTLNHDTNYYFTLKAVDRAGNESQVVNSAAWIVPRAPNAISNLSAINQSNQSVTLGWTAPPNGGREISDYLVEYKDSSSGTWIIYSDGVSSATQATITGLQPDTSYDFRVRASNGLVSNYSNILTAETAVDDPFFDPQVYRAMNLGGAVESSVVAFEDSTEIYQNESLITTLQAGQTFLFTSALNDQLSSAKPFFVAGRRGTGSDARKGNMVWSTPAWAGKNFIFTAGTSDPHILTVHAFEDSLIVVKQGSSTLDSASVSKGQNHTFSLIQSGGFTLLSSGQIMAFMHSANNGTSIIDPKPLLPASTDVIGFPSSSLKLTPLNSQTNYVGYHSNSQVNSGTLTAGTTIDIFPQGTSSLYQCEALRIIASDLVVGNSRNDSDGSSAAPFLPVAMMKQRYAINVNAEWVAFASVEPGTISAIDPASGQVTTLTLEKSGSDSNAPYKVRATGLAAGYRFESSIKFASWYEPSTNIGASDNDETIMFGY